MAQRLECKTLYENSIEYHDLILDIIHTGISDKPLSAGTKHPRPKWEDGTIAYTKSLNREEGYYYSRTYNLLKGELPFNSIRPLAIKSAIQEIFWIYQDQSNRLGDAHKRGIKWWDNHEVNKSGTIGFAYGKTVRDFNLLDKLLEGMEKDPFSRRHILSLWQEEHISKQLLIGGLVPCAYQTIFNIKEKFDFNDDEYRLQLESTSNLIVKPPVKRIVSLTLHQRSNDFIVANNINIIQYIAFGLKVCGHLTFKTGIEHILSCFTHNVEDCHVYEKHIPIYEEAIFENAAMLDSTFLNPDDCFLELLTNKNFYDYRIEDFNYKKPINTLVNCKFPVAI